MAFLRCYRPIITILLLLLFFQVQRLQSIQKPANVLTRLIREYEKLRDYEVKDRLFTFPLKRNYITNILASIIHKDELKTHKAKKDRSRISKKDNVAWQNYYNYGYPSQQQPSSAVESITYTSPQLTHVDEAENGLLNRMKEMTVADRKELSERRENITIEYKNRNNNNKIMHHREGKKFPERKYTNKMLTSRPLQLDGKQKEVRNNQLTTRRTQSSLKIGDKESDNPHPHETTLSTNEWKTIYKLAHEGNATDLENVDDLPNPKTSILKTTQFAKINPNPHPDFVQIKVDPLRLVAIVNKITQEDDEENSNVNHIKTSIRKTKHVLAKQGKHPGNKSLTTIHEDIVFNPLKVLKSRKKNKGIRLKAAKSVNLNNWTDRKSHALALLAKLASDLEQQDVIDNVLTALGVGDIINLDNPVVQHDDFDTDDFKDKNWVDEELGGSSGSGDHLISLHGAAKHQTHKANVLQNSFIKLRGNNTNSGEIIKGQPKDRIIVKQAKINSLKNIVDES